MNSLVCPYNPRIHCLYLDMSGMTQTKECLDCEHYQPLRDDRVRATGATPILAWFIDLFKSKKKKTETSEPFMYSCTCKHCGKKFSSSVPGFNCCPSCYI